ncbi:hypothetical protein PV408_48375, partial [Streptomyces sp. ME18-1-4]|nr:hypothetical protein [Streptomyces sp. ME18-1-4]
MPIDTSTHASTDTSSHASTDTTANITADTSTDLTFATAGTGRPVLVLHGGGGPATVAGLAAHLARTAHTLTPT